MTKEFKVIEKKKTKQTTHIWMESFNKILNEIKKKIGKTKFINEHSFTQFLKVYKPYIKIKSIVEKLKAAGDSTMSVKMYTFEKNVIDAKFKEIEQQNKKKIVLDELRQKKPRVRSVLSTSPKKRKRKSARSKNTKTKKSSILKSSMSMPNFENNKPTPETPKTADLPKLVFKRGNNEGGMTYEDMVESWKEYMENNPEGIEMDAGKSMGPGWEKTAEKVAADAAKKAAEMERLQRKKEKKSTSL